MYDDPELLNEFLIESRENLDRLDAELVLLEASPTDGELLSSVFRVVHTLKGTASFFEFHRLQSVAHAGETLLSRMRDGIIRLDAARTTVLLRMCDALRTMVEHVAEHGDEGTEDYAALLDALGVAAAEGPSATAAPAPAPAPAPPPRQAAAPAPAPVAAAPARSGAVVLIPRTSRRPRPRRGLRPRRSSSRPRRRLRAPWPPPPRSPTARRRRRATTAPTRGSAWTWARSTGS
ncbi:MAG: Hpt domain-containing protein [Deltaproteobacteria bacterium]|nr:Hpt domain-containing protein [Deltaproteobacteria bacterium]